MFVNVKSEAPPTFSKVDEGLCYELVIRDPRTSQRRALLYWPHTSCLTWKKTGEPVDLRHVGFFPELRKYDPVDTVSPDTPLGKTQNPDRIKIQIGMGCNFACVYCNQNEQRNRDSVKGNVKQASEFLNNLGTWYKGGSDGLGTGTRFEFWGGEPLMYREMLRFLTRSIRAAYPKAGLFFVTNASLLNEEDIDWIDAVDLRVAISHDGPNYDKHRPLKDGSSADPLNDPEKLAMIKLLFNRVNPFNRISFNCVLTRDSYSLIDIRNHIATKLGVPWYEVHLSTEEMLQPYDAGGLLLSPHTEEEHLAIVDRVALEGIKGGTADTIGTIGSKVVDFFSSLAFGRPSHAIGQKCGMDRSSHLAVNLNGEVLTCQNTSASATSVGKTHKIGEVADWENIKLTTSKHWVHREECKVCPVVQLCQGACMYNEGEYWKQGCDNAFSWNLAILKIAVYRITGGLLEEVRGDTIRRAGTTKVNLVKEEVL